MENKIVILLVATVVMLSCKSNQENTVRFAYQEKYLLNSNEKNLEINKNVVDEYEKFNGLSNLNIPLNRYIFNEDYKIFIAIAIENSELDIVNAIKVDSTLKILATKKYKNNLSLFCKRDNIFAIKYIFSEAKQKLPVIVNIISKDSLLIKRMYDQNNVVDKLQ